MSVLMGEMREGYFPTLLFPIIVRGGRAVGREAAGDGARDTVTGSRNRTMTTIDQARSITSRANLAVYEVAGKLFENTSAF